ncbi:hypothetical protein SLA_2459 [Streptomyces laurentii]|uniref:Uncharacterized protein n=1 Tax=Streptomyces laurentii TaxID=39478 RepID=A0A160NYW2_STRLU|nr:hypothetical protein SLA_2459 [Streptomyces laurentii]
MGDEQAVPARTVATRAAVRQAMAEVAAGTDPAPRDTALPDTTPADTALSGTGLSGTGLSDTAAARAVPGAVDPGWAAARPPTLADAAAVRLAAADLAAGRVVVHGFAHGYALTARADREVIARAGRLTGRPDGRPCAVTTVPSAIRGLFDWSRLPATLPRRQIWALIDELYELGPFGFRGPAAERVPGHLTAEADGVPRTVRVIAPGRHCPSNAFLTAALTRTGAGLLFVTAAHRPGEPPYGCGESARAGFGGEPDVRVLAHADDAAARLRHPFHAPAPVPVSVIAFHRAAGHGRADLPVLTLERAGSLSEDHIRSLAARNGFALSPAPGAVRAGG